MKRVLRSLFLFFSNTLFILSLVVCVCVPVYGDDSGTYTIKGTACEATFKFNNYSYNNFSIDDVRVFSMYNSSRLYYYAVSDKPFSYLADTGNSDCSGIRNNATSVSYNNKVYYVYYNYFSRSSIKEDYNYYSPSFPYSNPLNLSDEKKLAVYWTFGEGSVDPAPPGPDYGNLINVRFSTDIAGSGTAAVGSILDAN